MSELPVGTVTFLFTDLEGSTRLWEMRRDAMAIAASRHDAALREVVATHGGTVLSEMGDGIAAVFAAARDAVAAAIDVQLRLGAEDWGEVGPLRARVALHAGPGELRGDGHYVNQPLNRCARILAIAHGGQALVSESVEALVRSDLPPDTELVPLGEYHLRDVPQPMAVFQLAHPDLQHDFPPLRSLDAFARTVPLHTGSEWELVGRSNELARIVATITSGHRQPVVISGPAGVGKSRLAVEACRVVDREFVVEWCAATVASASIPFGPVTRLLAVDGGHGLLAETFRRSVDAIAARNLPTLIAVDDAQLLDDASAALVHQLAINRAASVLLTVRSGDPAPDPITAVWKDGDAHYVELRELSRDDMALLVTTVLGGPVEEDTVDRLWELTNGNLLFLREILHAAEEEGAFVRVRGAWRWRGSVGAPRRVADVVHLRLGTLDDRDREALSLLAFAEPLPMAMLGRVVDESILTKLAQRGLVLVEDAGQSRLVRLAHPLYSEVLRAELSPLEEVQASRQLAEAAVATGTATGAHLRWVSAWALEAGVELPLNVITDAARAALGAADPQRAEQLARAAFARRRSSDVAQMLGEALFALQRYEEAATIFVEATELAESDEERVRAAIGAAQAFHYGLGQVDAGDAALEAAARHIEDAGWRQVLSAQHARMLGFAGQVEEAGEIAIPMLDSPDERVRLRALTPAATLLTLRGETDRVLDVTEALLEPALRHRHELPHAPMWVASARAPALMFAGELDAATSLLDTTNRSNPISEREDRGYLILAYGRLALARGRVADAVRILREGVGLLDETNRAGRQGWGLLLLAEALALVGDARGAALAVTEASQVAGPTNRIYQGDAQRARAWERVGAGDVHEAITQLLDVADAHRVQAPVCELYALHDAIRLGSAATVADRLVGVATRIDGRAARTFADHACAAKNADGTALDSVSAQFEAMSAILLAADASASAAAVHRRAGDNESASRSAARAARLADACQGAATPLLRQLGDGEHDLTTRS